MPKVGVVLSGCGAQDGAEIHESVITLLALDRAGAEVITMAPDMNQFHVINHLNNEEIDTSRNILIESARIARGNIVDVATVTGNELDALIFPGGTGMAKNIFDYAMAGSMDVMFVRKCVPGMENFRRHQFSLNFNHDKKF